MMIRTEKRLQLYLPALLYQEAKRFAINSNVSLAELVRKALTAYLTLSERKRPDWTSDPLSKGVGFISEGPTDLAEGVDEYLYK